MWIKPGVIKRRERLRKWSGAQEWKRIDDSGKYQDNSYYGPNGHHSPPREGWITTI